MLLNEYEVDDNDCCGNGCTNCILDPKSSIPGGIDLKNKINVLLKYRDYKLTEKVLILPYILMLKFQLMDKEVTNLDNIILDIPPGHHVMMRSPLSCIDIDEKNNSTITRPYSPFWTDRDKYEFKILVNLKPNGVMTNHIRRLEITNSVKFRGPVGNFIHKIEEGQSLMIYTQGVAVAPTLRIIQEVLNNEDDATKIHFACCFLDLANVLFRDEIHEFNKFWNFYGKIYLSQESSANFKCKLKYKEQIFDYRLKEIEIQNYFKNIDLKLCKVVICGSKSFEKFILKCIQGIGVIKEHIFLL